MPGRAGRLAGFRTDQQFVAELEQVKGIERSYSAWKAIGKPNELRGGWEKECSKQDVVGRVVTAPFAQSKC